MAGYRVCGVGRAAAWPAVLAVLLAVTSACTLTVVARPTGGGLHPPHVAGGAARVSWWIPDRRAGGIAGFVDPVGVRAGRPVRLFVSTRARLFRVRAFRMGWYGGVEARQVWLSRPVRGIVQPGPVLWPAATGTVTTRWRASLSVDTRGWLPGVYLLRLEAAGGGEGYVPLTLRAASAVGRVVLISPVTTWQAYNLWGCCDLYQGRDGSFATRSRAVSFDRPYLAEHGAGDFLRGELGVLAEAARLRLPLDFVTDVDLDQHPNLLDGTRAVVSMGHDEYWSPAMRANLAGAIGHGVNVAFFGANGIFRRIRFAPTRLGADRLEINYKIASEDPLDGRDDPAVTADWPAAPDPNPESRLLGAQYACNLGPGANVDAVVVDPHSWLFAGTHLRAGTKLPGLVGPETDAVQPSYPTPRPIEVLLQSATPCPSGGADYADTSYYTAASGGGVFDAGTIAWACAIDAQCAHPVPRSTAAVTREVSDNLLRAFAVGPAGTLHPARDNLAALGITHR